MSIWFFINATVLLFGAWKIITGYVGIHVMAGALGLVLVLYNWTRHAVYATIRSNITRQRKIKYAKLTKSVRKYHQWVGFSAIGLIFLHMVFVLYVYPFQLSNPKMLSGLLAMIMLGGVVMTGWRRKKVKTRSRHILHLIFGYGMFAVVVLHLVM